ncbi:hypothetical protein Tco_1413285, partial [Tanacetum coccineum]
ASPRVHRRSERVVGFEEIQNKWESRVERSSKGRRTSEEASRGNGSQNVNLPPLLAAHIGRSKNRVKGQKPALPYKGESPQNVYPNLVKSPRDILATERVAKTFERPPWLPGPNWSKDKTRYCHFHKDYGHETNKCQELKHQIEEAVKTGQLTHLVKGVTKKREKTSDTQSGEKKKEEKPALEKTSILMVSGRDHRLKKRHASDNGTGEITFPPIPNEGSSDPVVIKVYISGRQVNRAYLDSGSSCEVIYEHCFLKLKPSIRSLRVDSNTPLVGFSGEESRDRINKVSIRSPQSRGSPHDHEDTYIRNRKVRFIASPTTRENSYARNGDRSIHST